MQRVTVVARHVMATSAVPVQVAPCAAPEVVVKEMAPTGKLRVALNMRNSLMIKGKGANGVPEGVAPSIATAFAEKLGVPVEFVEYDAPDKLAGDAAQDKWDLAMIGADPARGALIDFTPAYCQIEATYAVPTTSGAQKCADIDKEGVRIASCNGAAYTLWLERNLKSATLEKVEGHEETADFFVEEGCEAIAGLRSKLKKDRPKATRLLRDKFMAVEQAAGTKKGRDAGFKMLCEFMEDAKKSGLVKQFLEKYKVAGDLTIP